MAETLGSLLDSQSDPAINPDRNVRGFDPDPVKQFSNAQAIMAEWRRRGRIGPAPFPSLLNDLDRKEAGRRSAFFREVQSLRDKPNPRQTILAQRTRAGNVPAAAPRPATKNAGSQPFTNSILQSGNRSRSNILG